MSNNSNEVNSAPNSRSESSSSSPNQTPFSQEHVIKETDITDLTLFGAPAPMLFRSGTVRRANSTPIKKVKDVQTNGNEEGENNVAANKSLSSPEQNFNAKTRFRMSLDSNFRRSLESIHENKPTRCFSPTLTFTSNSREHSSSLESFSSDQTDYAVRSNTDAKEGKTLQSPGSSYLTWIESVHSEYFGSANSRTETTDVDNKVGEWNNFWLNYNSARSRYLSSTSAYQSTEDRMIDDNNSEIKSTGSTQKELMEKSLGDTVSLTLDEIYEALKCSKRITEIFQNALHRNEHDYENSCLENSFYSEPFSRQNSSVHDEPKGFTRDDFKQINRQRSSSYAVSSQDLLKQKEALKPTVQSSSTSCINAILNTGVADILKKVINKRRDVMSDEVSSMTRRSFSEWNSK